MARKRQSEKVEPTGNVRIDLAREIGFTPIGDSKYSSIQDFIPTFIPQLDKILGGGIPFGRISEIFSPEAVGKSTMVIYLTRIATMLGVDCLWIDTEGTSDPERMEELGVDTDAVSVFEPKTENGENMNVETVQAAVEAVINKYNTDEYRDRPVLVIWDSVGGTVTKAEQDVEAGDTIQRGRQAAAVTALVRKVTPMIKDINMAFVVINQVRDNQNMMNKFDTKYTRPGGRALDHAESLRLELRRSTQIKGRNGDEKEDSKVGHYINVITDKSKITRPKQSTKVILAAGWEIPETKDPTYGATPLIADGIDYEYNVYNSAVDLGIIKASGAYKKYIDPDTGEVINLYELDWLRRLKQDKELRQRLAIANTAAVFPKAKPAYMNNKHIDIHSWKEVAPIADYFDSRPDSTEPKPVLETETPVQETPDEQPADNE